MRRLTYSSNPMSPGARFFFSYIFPYPFVIIGAVVAFLGIRNLDRARDSMNWPSAEGKIVSSSVRESMGSDSKTYHADIAYEFSVADAVHSGNRISFGDYGTSNPSHARGIVERYPEGLVVTVYYRSDRPKECVLELGITKQARFVPIFGSLCFVVGCVMAIGIPLCFRLASAREQKSKNSELSKRKKRLLVLFGLSYSFVIVGGLVAVWGVYGLIRAKQSTDWPPVEGTITRSSVERNSNKDEETYHAKIMYEYSVAGIVYEGNRVAYGDYGSSDSSHARGIVERYPEGLVVAVYYMPNRPKVCVLVPGLKGQAWFFPGIGFLFFIVGCVTAIGLPIAAKRPAIRHYWK